MISRQNRDQTERDSSVVVLVSFPSISLVHNGSMANRRAPTGIPAFFGGRHQVNANLSFSTSILRVYAHLCSPGNMAPILPFIPRSTTDIPRYIPLRMYASAQPLVWVIRHIVLRRGRSLVCLGVF